MAAGFLVAHATRGPVLSAEMKTYLDKYFGGADQYQLLKRRMSLGKIKLIFAVRDIDMEPFHRSGAAKGILLTEPIRLRGIGVEVKENAIIPHVFFEKDRILDGRRRVIIDVSDHHLEYVGWRIYPENEGIHLDYIFLRRGLLSVPDSLGIHWDSTSARFVHDTDHNE